MQRVSPRKAERRRALRAARARARTAGATQGAPSRAQGARGEARAGAPQPSGRPPSVRLTTFLIGGRSPSVRSRCPACRPRQSARSSLAIAQAVAGAQATRGMCSGEQSARTHTSHCLENFELIVSPSSYSPRSLHACLLRNSPPSWLTPRPRTRRMTRLPRAIARALAHRHAVTPLRVATLRRRAATVRRRGTRRLGTMAVTVAAAAGRDKATAPRLRRTFSAALVCHRA